MTDQLEKLNLTPDEAKVVQDLIDNPPEPNEALRKAMQRRKEFMDPIHPGEILKEEFMVPLGISINELGRCLWVPAGRISEIVNGKRAISADTALRLGRFFGNSPDIWLGLQKDYELRLARRESGAEIEANVKPLERTTGIDESRCNCWKDSNGTLKCPVHSSPKKECR